MAVPKRKMSKQKMRQRKASHKKSYPSAHQCSNCGSPCMAHRMCPSCGHYRGRQVDTIEAA